MILKEVRGNTPTQALETGAPPRLHQFDVKTLFAPLPC
jgi:hypothetical protein